MSMAKKTEISAIIPVYNKSKTILECIESLFNQTVINRCEIILVDDGSTGGSRELLQSLSSQLTKKTEVRLYHQRHSGPGVARNLGARKANGTILVFVDADMVFEKNFLENLTLPIFLGKAIGTDSQEEYLANPGNFWAKSWNIGRFAAAGFRNLPENHSIVPNKVRRSTIFRAIKKSVFDSVGGFETDGDYTDDESLYKKSGEKSLIVKAKFYHYDPDSLSEVCKRAFWIGSGKNFTGYIGKKWGNLVKFSPPVSLVKGLFISVYYSFLPFIIFKVIYDFSVWLAIIKSFGHKSKHPETLPSRKGD